MTRKNKDAFITAAQSAFGTTFRGVLMLAPDDGAPVWIDGRKSPPAFNSAPPKTQKNLCCLHGAEEVLIRALSGERALENAYVSGRLRISGDISVMGQLQVSSSR